MREVRGVLVRDAPEVVVCAVAPLLLAGALAMLMMGVRGDAMLGVRGVDKFVRGEMRLRMWGDDHRGVRGVVARDACGEWGGSLYERVGRFETRKMGSSDCGLRLGLLLSPPFAQVLASLNPPRLGGLHTHTHTQTNMPLVSDIAPGYYKHCYEREHGASHAHETWIHL
jgi:hypothetical protein